MKKTLVILSLVLLAVLASSVAISAQGGVDPTGNGRYTVVGREMAHPNATVVAQLPPDASICTPAGEMDGAIVWNSTKKGMANKVKLTEKATISSTTDGRIFLCKCMQGFNQLFLLNQQEPQPAITQQQSQGIAVKVVNNITAAKGADGPPGPASTVPGPQGARGLGCTVQKIPDQKGKLRDAIVCEDGTNALIPQQKGMSTTTKVVIGTTVAATTTALILCVFLKKCGKVPPRVGLNGGITGGNW